MASGRMSEPEADRQAIVDRDDNDGRPLKWALQVLLVGQ
jgi:hypothetical protein